MYYYVYLIVNLINGKYYIGAHATNNLHDGYMGSGYLIQAAIEKYGVEYFVKEILRYCDTREEMFEYEAELVTQDLVDDPMCYNMVVGGCGGDLIHSLPKEKFDEWRAKLSTARKGKPTWNKGLTLGPQSADFIQKRTAPLKGRKHSEEWRLNISNALKNSPNSNKGKPTWNKGKSWSEETKQKMSAAKKGKKRQYRPDGTYYYA